MPRIAGVRDPDGVFRPYIRIAVQIPGFGKFESKSFCKSFKVVEALGVAVVGRDDFFAKYSVDFADWHGPAPSMRIERR